MILLNYMKKNYLNVGVVNFIKNSSVVLTAVAVIAGGFFVPNTALAVSGATITPASGGINISIDTTSAGATPSFTLLSGPTITEAAPGDIAAGTHTITLPEGWKFDISQVVKVNGGVFTPTTQDAVITENTLSFTITEVSSSPGVLSFISDLSGNSIKVMPTGIESGISDDLTHSGVAIDGVIDGTTSFGTLSTVAGVVTQIVFIEQPVDTEYGSLLSPQPAVETRDQFDNHSINGASGKTVTLTLDSEIGVLHGTETLDIGTGVATFTDLTVDSVGVDNILTASVDGFASVDSGHFTITPATLTITADTQIKVYGQSNPTLTASYEGFVFTEDENVLTNPVVLDVVADTTTPVGTVVITSSGATADNYDITFTNGILTITPAPLTVTADAKGKIYGEADPALTYLVTSGTLINEDTLVGDLLRVAGKNVGTYAINQGTLDNSNYEITFNSDDLTITKKALTVTAVIDTKIYDGDTTSDETSAITIGEIVDGDVANFIQTYDDENVAGSKTLTPSGVVNDGNSGLNYSYTYNTVSTGVITVAPLTITAEAKTKIYGTSNPTLTVGYTGLVGSDTSGVVSGLSITAVDEVTTPVGTVVITPSGATASNYTISFVSGVLTITPAPLTVTADAQTKVYGEVDPTLTHLVTSGTLINDDTLVGDLSRAAGKNVGAHVITQGDLDNSNYDITFVSDNLTINQKALTITAATDTKTYDSDTTSSATPLITGDLQFTDTPSFTQTYDDKNVGGSKTLTPRGVVDDENGGANYAYTYEVDSTGVITQAPLTATVTVSNKVVDGNSSAIITGRTLIGVIPEDDVTANEDGTATFENALFGNDKAVSATGITLSGNDAGNYSYDNTATGTGNILPIPIVVYVNGSWAGKDVWTDPDGDSGADYFGYDAFATIQEGINAVKEGGIVNVATGIYTGNITVNKSVIIQGNAGDTSAGPGTNAPVIDGGSTVGSAFFIANEVSDVTIKGFEMQGFTSDANGIGNGISAWVANTSDITIEDNYFHNLGWNAVLVGNDGALGDHTGWTIKNNIVENYAAYGLELTNASNSSLENNIIQATNSWTGIAVIARRSESVITIKNNQISGSIDDTGDSGRAAIYIIGWGHETTDLVLNDVVIEGNSLSTTGTKPHIRVAEFATGSVTGVTIVSNNLSTLVNNASAQINAEANYWGTAVLATIEGNVSGDVDFEPYYVDAVGGILSSTAVGTVYVDDNYSDGSADTHIFGYDAFDKIQDGINVVTEGGTVNVAAGTYNESLLIEKSLTLRGATYNVNKNGYIVPANYDWNTETESIINHPDPAGGYISIVDIVDVDNVTFEGFVVQELDAIANLNSSLIRVYALTREISNIIVRNNIIGPNTNVISQDGTHGRMGLYIVNHPYSDKGVVNSTFSGNKIFDTKGNGNNVFVWSSYYTYGAPGPASMSGTVIEDNEIYGSHRSGIETAGGFSGLTIQNNKIYDNGGVITEGKPELMFGNGILIIRGSGDRSTCSAYGPVNLTIENNEIYDNDNNGIYMGPKNQNIVITNNEIYDNGSDAVRVDLIGNYWNPDFEIDPGPYTCLAGSSDISLNSNKIYGNSGGAQVIGTPTNEFVLDAIANWWGSVEGPTYVDNPFGGGDAISSNVNFVSWYTNPELFNLDTIAPTAVLSGLPTNPTDQISANITVGNGNVVYYKYKLDGGEYSGETIVATPITLAELSEISYTLSVLGRDQAGNWQSVATTYTWEVDVSIPTLSPVSITSNNGNGATLAKVGDVVTVEFTSNEDINTPTVTIAGNTTVVSGGPTVWEAAYTMAGTETESLVAFAINFTDVAGNLGAQVIIVTDASSVVFDETVPAGYSASLDQTYINDGNKTALSFTFVGAETDTIYNYSIDDTNAGTTAIEGSGTITVADQQIIDIDVSTLDDDTLTLTISLTDPTGNQGSDETDTVIKDVIPPTVASHTPGINAINVESGVVTITFNENMNVEEGDITFSPAETFVISGSGTETVTLTPDLVLDSNTVYTITVTTTTTDEAGNGLAGEYDWQFTTATLYDVTLNSTSGGWNLVSLPVVPNDTSISTVLGSAESSIQAVWTYNPTSVNANDTNGGWFVYRPDDVEHSSLSTMTAGYGYWISVTNDTSISGSGSLLTKGPTTPPSIDLTNGWNLVGYYQIPGESSSNMTNAFKSIGTAGTDYTSLFGFNNASGASTNVDTILPGDGFWISVSPAGGKNYTPSNL